LLALDWGTDKAGNKNSSDILMLFDVMMNIVKTKTNRGNAKKLQLYELKL